MRSGIGIGMILAVLGLGTVRAEGLRETHACAAMATDSASGLAVSTAGVKASAANRMLRTQARIGEGDCVSYLEIAGSTTAPGGPVWATLYVLRSGQQAASVAASVAIPEGKAGVFTARFSPVCLGRGDAAYLTVSLNAGGGVPYETAACSYVALGE
jgi:hypothetical protein